MSGIGSSVFSKVATTPVTSGGAYGGMAAGRCGVIGAGTAQWDILDESGNSMRKNNAPFWGTNLGQFDYFNMTEGPSVVSLFQSMGINLVRLVGFFRWCSDPAKGDADSYDPTCPIYTHPANIAKLMYYTGLFADANIRYIIVGEGDIIQSSLQSTAIFNKAISLAQPWETIPGGQLTWDLVGGFNIFTSKFLFQVFRERMKWVARTFRSKPMCFAYEPQSEPLVWQAGTSLGSDFDSTWSAGTRADGTLTLEQVYRTIATDIRGDAATGKPVIDGKTMLIFGGRHGYNLPPEMSEIVTALKNPAGLGGDLTQNALFTFDLLSSGTIVVHQSVPHYQQALALNVAIFQNQEGSRTSDDPSDYGLNVNIGVARSLGIPGTLWDARGNGISGYGFQYQTAQDVYANVAYRIANLTARWTETLATLEAAAIAAATAEHAMLFYVKADLSNCYAADGVTQLTVGTVVPGTTTCGKILPVTDPDGVGMFFSATGTACPTLAYPQVDGSGNPWIPHKRLGFNFDGANQFFSGAGTNPAYWASGALTGNEAMTFIAAGIQTGGTSANRDLLNCASAGSARYPRMYVTAGNNCGFSTVTDTLTVSLSGSLTAPLNIPCVWTMFKSGNSPSTAYTLEVNGYQDAGASEVVGGGGALVNQTPGAIAAGVTRCRWGGLGAAASWIGNSVGVCLSKQAMATANKDTICRFFAALHAGGYRI